MRLRSITLRRTAMIALLGASCVCAVAQDTTASASASAPAPKKHPKTPEELRADYIKRLQERSAPAADEHTLGSLWTSQSPLGDISSDYKAYHLNDTITIQVSVQTTATQSGTVDSERSFSTTSAVTGVMGRTPASTNPLLSANSSQALKGQGSTASNTLFQTNLTGQVIAVLPNGNLVVEAGRKIFMNNQHENVIVRGMIRPGDIGPNNTVASSALSNLEIEMKGKGIISDGTRPLNPITRAILWLLNF
jgi:flagellar L-ring protein precursor FlgH